ncbi:hypothetical protein V6N13_005761 [Hibiscus sabdariffa]
MLVVSRNRHVNIPQKILKSLLAAHIIFILVVFMNGWKGVKVVQYVARKWSSVKAPKSVKSDFNAMEQIRIERQYKSEARDEIKEYERTSACSSYGNHYVQVSHDVDWDSLS